MPDQQVASRTAPAPATVVRRAYLAMCLLLLTQFVFGMAVNLFVTIPEVHPGSEPANYFAGSLSSVSWAIPDGGPWLAVHAVLGLTLAAGGLVVAVLALRHRGRTLVGTAVAGWLAIVGAGFNGASFLDFGHDVSSMIMAGLFAVALVCYLVGIYICTGQTPEPN